MKKYILLGMFLFLTSFLSNINAQNNSALTSCSIATTTILGRMYCSKQIESIQKKLQSKNSYSSKIKTSMAKERRYYKILKTLIGISGTTSTSYCIAQTNLKIEHYLIIAGLVLFNDII